VSANGKLLNRIAGKGKADCELCHGAGLRFVRTADGRIVRAPCPCARDVFEAERAAMLREMCNVSAEHLERYRFSSFFPGKCASNASTARERRDDAETMARIKAVCERWAEEPNGWLLLQGNVGSGKSHLAFAIAGRLLERGVGVYWDTVPELWDRLREGYNSGTYTERLEAMQRVQVLILDDLGTENGTAWVLEKGFQLMNRRYLEQRPTVVTTNLDMFDAKVAIDPRIRSRLLDATFSTVLTLPAADYRVPVAEGAA
jgi:DNA replication protein DnaC